MEQASFARQRIALPALLGMLGTFAMPAQAIEGTLFASQPSPYEQGTLQLSPTTNRLALSETSLRALRALDARIEALGPGKVIAAMSAQGNRYTSVTIDVPIGSLTADVDTTLQFSGLMSAQMQATALGFVSHGGFRLSTIGEGITSTGGSLSITNLNVNLRDKRIHADVEGANGVGLIKQVALWRFDAMTALAPLTHTRCMAAPVMTCHTNFTVDTTLSGLRFETEAFELFSDSLGLLPDGRSVLSKGTDFGTFAANVPEAGTWAQMGLGLAALGMLAARRRRSTQ